MKSNVFITRITGGPPDKLLPNGNLRGSGTPSKFDSKKCKSFTGITVHVIVSQRWLVITNRKLYSHTKTYTTHKESFLHKQLMNTADSTVCCHDETGKTNQILDK